MQGLPNRFDPKIHEIYKIAQERNFGSACPFEGSDANVRPECLLGLKDKNGPVDVVLVGDSHGYHFAAAIDGVLKEHDLSGKLITRAGCIALPGITIDPSDRIARKRRCDEFLDSVTEFFMTDTEAKLIIISLRWETYSNSKFKHSANANKINPVKINTSEIVLERALRRNIEMLSAKGKRVLLIGQVPPHQTSPLTCAARSLYAQNDVNQCSVKMHEINERIGFSNTLLRKVAQEYEMIDSFIPADTLCRDGSCPVFLDGVFLYRDGDHINDAGSKEFAKYINRLPVFFELSRMELSVASEGAKEPRTHK